jgi:hypothetical protein
VSSVDFMGFSFGVKPRELLLLIYYSYTRLRGLFCTQNRALASLLSTLRCGPKWPAILGKVRSKFDQLPGIKIVSKARKYLANNQHRSKSK